MEQYHGLILIIAAVLVVAFRIAISIVVTLWKKDKTVCLLSKLNVEQHIEVELTMDEMDLTAAEKKASYEEIKGKEVTEWITENIWERIKLE